MKLNETQEINNLIEVLLDAQHDIRRNRAVDVEHLLTYLMDADNGQNVSPEFKSAIDDVGEFVDLYQADRMGITQGERLLYGAVTKLRQSLKNGPLTEGADPDIIKWMNRLGRL